MKELRHSCQDNSVLLSQMLTTPFIDGQTPLQWILTRLPDIFFAGSQKMDTKPSIISTLLAAASDNPVATGTLVQTCCERGGNALFQLFNEKRQFDHCSTAYGVIVKSVKAPPDQSKRPIGILPRLSFDNRQDLHAEFSIPNFPERMLIDGFIDIRFVAAGQNLYLYNHTHPPVLI